jgi:hypothetical protein
MGYYTTGRRALIITGAATAVALALIVSKPIAQGAPRTVLLDNFEGGLRIAVPSETTPQYRDLWNQYTSDFYGGCIQPCDPGLALIATNPVHDGTKALQVHLTPSLTGQGNLYMSFYPNDGVHWHFMREYVQPPSAWQLDTFNRMRLWVRFPSNVGAGLAVPTGQYNLSVGTYVMKSTADGSQPEDGGGHFYHNFDIPYTGAWHQIIVDMHPTHRRGDDPSFEWGTSAYYITHETGFNYFDALNRFYFDLQGDLPNGPPPADFYFDGFELYQDTNPENVNQIYSLNAAYVASSNTVVMGWNRRKDEQAVAHEVRYAFSDIYALGYGNASVAPNSPVKGGPDGVYNQMKYSTTAINVAGHTTLYMAIKPQNSNLFRQIVIPLTPSSTPAAPTNVRIG